MNSRKIIIDCDPGHDDAVAILLALASPKEIDILGITCVAGNVPIEMTTKNALRVCELAGFTSVNVYQGCARPIVRDLVTAEYVHGDTGLDLPRGRVLPEPKMARQKEHAVDFIIDTLLSEPEGMVTLCVLGPQTNVAMAFIKEPAIIPRIREVICMGGSAISPGNVTPSAEFNFYVDPHAASVVFRSGVPITMMGLDVTHQVLVTKDRQKKIRANGGKTSSIVADLMEFYCQFDIGRYGMDGGPLHDPCVIAHVLEPTMFSMRHINVVIELDSLLTLGESVADWWGVTDRTPNCHVCESVNDELFFDLLIERLSKLP